MSQREINYLFVIIGALVVCALLGDAVRWVYGLSRRGNYKRGYIAAVRRAADGLESQC